MGVKPRRLLLLTRRYKFRNTIESITLTTWLLQCICPLYVTEVKLQTTQQYNNNYYPCVMLIGKRFSYFKPKYYKIDALVGVFWCSSWSDRRHNYILVTSADWWCVSMRRVVWFDLDKQRQTWRQSRTANCKYTSCSSRLINCQERRKEEEEM